MTMFPLSSIPVTSGDELILLNKILVYSLNTRFFLIAYVINLSVEVLSHRSKSCFRLNAGSFFRQDSRVKLFGPQSNTAAPRANSIVSASQSLNNASYSLANALFNPLRSLNSPVSLRGRRESSCSPDSLSNLSVRELAGQAQDSGVPGRDLSLHGRGRGLVGGGRSLLKYRRSHETFSRSHLKVAQDIVGSR
jgi:hypothetical protein